MNHLKYKNNQLEHIEKIIIKKNNEVTIELLNKLLKINPVFFEGLVIKLLDKMGYIGKNGSIKVTTQSNNDGIDGIINQNLLGTSTGE